MGLEVSPGEMLTAMQLGQELTALEEATGSSATLIVDAAHAGNFIRDLSQQGRQVIASTGPGLAFYQAEGYMSFSQYFLTDLYQGKSLQEAFLHTHNILRNLPGGFRDQRPGLEAEGNVIANQPGDYLQTMDAFIGAPFELGDLSPQIKASSLSSVAGGAGKRIVTQTAPISEDGLGPRLKLARPVAEQGVEISARIDDAEGNLKVVRAMIIPPESDSLSSLTGYPEVELAVDADGQWRGVYAGFLKEGVYPVIIYAIDGAGNSAEPLRTTVLVEASETPGLLGDFNGDGLVDFADFFMFADAFGGDDPAYDLDQSGLVDFGDFFLFADAFGGPLGKLLELAEEMLVLPTSYALGVPYPNPFNSEVVVKYSLPREGDVELVVYNTLGQVVRRLVEGQRRLGHHRAVWDGRDDDGRQLATGMYIMWMRAGDFIKGHKVVLVK
ncbi:MAG: T9SS type A sorting domain-containing protein [Gemmatimonadetes bacterium]|nr:T9SS type A sorting domain-containing protein [Gemmatimonadota bacterium]